MVTNEVVAPDGRIFRTIATFGAAPNREHLPKASSELKIHSASWFKKTYECGHRGPRRFSLFVYGSVVSPSHDNHDCPACCMLDIQNTVIRCASCELPIFPDDSVVLYHPTTPGLNLVVAKFLNDNAVMCCLRRNCCTHPEFLAGTWTTNGFKQFPFEDYE